MRPMCHENKNIFELKDTTQPTQSHIIEEVICKKR